MTQSVSRSMTPISSLVVVTLRMGVLKFTSPSVCYLWIVLFSLSSSVILWILLSLTSPSPFWKDRRNFTLDLLLFPSLVTSTSSIDHVSGSPPWFERTISLSLGLTDFSCLTLTSHPWPLTSRLHIRSRSSVPNETDVTPWWFHETRPVSSHPV